MTSYNRIVHRSRVPARHRREATPDAAKYRAWIKDPDRNARNNRWWWRVQDLKAALGVA